MNQVMPLGKGILIAIDHDVRPQRIEEFRAAWKDNMPDVPAVFMGNTRIIVSGDKPIVFEFGDQLTPEIAAEFKSWWEEVNGND